MADASTTSASRIETQQGNVAAGLMSKNTYVKDSPYDETDASDDGEANPGAWRIRGDMNIFENRSTGTTPNAQLQKEAYDKAFKEINSWTPSRRYSSNPMPIQAGSVTVTRTQTRQSAATQYSNANPSGFGSNRA